MPILIVVNDPQEWPLTVSGVTVISARAYLTDPHYANLHGAKVFNCCRSYRYQSTGYYVSLLATARGHKPFPNITTIQDMKSPSIVRLMSDDIQELIEHSLADIRSAKFTLSIYFGKNLARKYDKLSSQLFRLFQAPFLRAQFVRNGHWELRGIGPISAMEIPDQHQAFVKQEAAEFFGARRFSVQPRTVGRYELAILADTTGKNWASDDAAIKKFVKAAAGFGIETEVIDKDDFGRVAEFDALFIRETTSVNHHTYRFSRRAVEEGLVTIDDPESILKCTNKVYLAELLDHHKVRTPKTLIVHKDNLDEIVPLLGLPFVLKQPDSSFSQGVIKIEEAGDVRPRVDELLERSELVIAQEFLPTSFDWRVCVLDRKPLFACKYFMAPKHWQIIHRDEKNEEDYGRVQSVPVELVPAVVIRTALKAANLIGAGLYGVDLKQVNRQCYVIEINDNPTIQSGFEDALLKDELYRRIMEVFLARLDRHRQGIPA